MIQLRQHSILHPVQLWHSCDGFRRQQVLQMTSSSYRIADQVTGPEVQDGGRGIRSVVVNAEPTRIRIDSDSDMCVLRIFRTISSCTSR